MTYLLLSHLAKKRELSITKDDVADLLLYIIVGVILGARIFYVFVYNLPFYLSNPFEIIAIWHGGLAFHGGLIGAVIALIYYVKKKNISFYEIADIAVIPVALGLALGRLGNFTNGELIGHITNVSWCVDYSQNQFIGNAPEGCRHPSQIYASFKNLIIFFTLWAIKDKNLPKGFMFWTFIVMYSTLRFLVGFFRTPDPQLGFILGPLTMGQLLNIIMFAVGAFFLYRVHKKGKQE
tara:strand:+ start:4242 stop:4949 length:708 start_codon:yes stop_codon:yes gene_type:complete